MFNLIKKDFLLLLSNKTTVLIFLLFIPLYRLVLGMDPDYSIVLLSIVTIGYMLTTTSFSFEFKNKPYIFIRSLPIKARDVIFSKYIEIFINYLVAIIYTFLSSKALSLLGVNITGSFNITTLQQSLLILVIGLSISLPLQFKLPPKVANFVNIFFYISILNYFSMTLGESSLKNLSNVIQFTLAILILLISIVLSFLLYRNKDLS